MTLTQYDPIAKSFDLYAEASQDKEKATSDEVGAALDGENIPKVPDHYFMQGNGRLPRIRSSAVNDAVPKKLEELIEMTDESLVGEVAKAKSTDNFDEAVEKLKVFAPVIDYENPQVPQDHGEYQQIAHALAEKNLGALGQYAVANAPEGWEGTFAEASKGPGSEAFVNHVGTLLAEEKVESMKEALSKPGKTADYVTRSTTQTIMGIEDPQQRAVMTAQLYLDKLKLKAK